MERLLLVDADQIFYVKTSGHQYETQFTGDEPFRDAWMFEGDTYLASNIKEAEQDIVQKLNEITADFDRAILCFTSTPNFRHEVLPSYKGGRTKKRKPLGYWDLVDKFCEGDVWETRKIPGLEADDVMSILATNKKYLKDYVPSIYSQDKDMLQVPDTDIIKPDGMVYHNTELEANHFRYIQALTGDMTDGYKGCPKVGLKTAERILESLAGSSESVYLDAVIDAYKSHGVSVAKAMAQVNCAIILRHWEYNFKTKKPLLKKAKDRKK